MIGLGVVVRGNAGVVRAALAMTVPHITDPTLVEAMAAWKAMSLSYDLGLMCVIFEGDSMQVWEGYFRVFV
jgi:hypothetical protein